jgi:AmmeMemoRadiSam system protein A
MKDLVLKLAREAVETYVKTGRRMAAPEHPKEMDERKGVFVTLYTKPKELRGCIGFPYPQQPLIDGLLAAAVEACRDPRFPPLSKDELKDVWIEVSILSKPEPIEASGKDLLRKIEPGKDGLIIKKGYCSGLFLPQVWEQLPKKEDFLDSLCMKAGLMSGEWLNSSAKVYKFQVKAYAER